MRMRSNSFDILRLPKTMIGVEYNVLNNKIIKINFSILQIKPPKIPNPQQKNTPLSIGEEGRGVRKKTNAPTL